MKKIPEFGFIVPEIKLTSAMLTRNGWLKNKDGEYWPIGTTNIPSLWKCEDGSFCYYLNSNPIRLNSVADLYDMLDFFGRSDISLKFKIYKKDKEK